MTSTSRSQDYADLAKATKRGAIIDLPKLDKLEKGICGACQLGKQIRTCNAQPSTYKTMVDSWRLSKLIY
jgi:hypothetical protein